MTKRKKYPRNDPPPPSRPKTFCLSHAALVRESWISVTTGGPVPESSGLCGLSGVGP